MNLAKQTIIPHPYSKEKHLLSEEDIATYLKELKGNWTLKGNKISRTFTFKDFVTAMNFVNTVAAIAEEANHHPDISIFYNKVTIELWTHGAEGLSLNDFIVAARVDAL